MSEEDLRAEIERRLLAEDCGLAPSADVLRLLDDVARAESERDAARESLRIDRETSHVAIATLRGEVDRAKAEAAKFAAAMPNEDELAAANRRLRVDYCRRYEGDVLRDHVTTIDWLNRIEAVSK